MASFSKEHDRNVFPCPIYCVKWGLQNLVITAPARIGFTAFNRVCSIGHPVIYDTALVITKGSNPTKSDQSGPTPFLCGVRRPEWPRATLRLLKLLHRHEDTTFDIPGKEPTCFRPIIYQITKGGISPWYK